MQKTIYFTTTLPYVNAKPHIGHAKEFIQADVFSRIYKSMGYETFFNTGTDEHGAKILEKATEEGKTAQEYCNEQSQTFLDFCEEFNVEYSNFIRTTDPNHIKATQEFWQKCDENGYIYKKNYKAKYCVGCELEKTDSELVDGECPDHPGKPLEIIEEENYFFKWSAFGKKLLKFYNDNPDFVKPTHRFNEIKAFVERGLEDFSISRLKEKMPWGIEVPGDADHVMYVWFDALVNYISTLGWSSNNQENYNKFWPGIQFCGKDNLRQQSAMWQAMLMAADLPNSKRVYVNGFIISDGKKMSKTLGNVIDPFEMKEKFGADATRYLLLASGTFGEDTDITFDKLAEKYNADLANGIGNLTSRVITLYAKLGEDFELKPSPLNFSKENLKEGKLEEELDRIIQRTKTLDKMMEEEKPWELNKKDPEKFKEVMEKLVQGIYEISQQLAPFVPETSLKIQEALKQKTKVHLFGRI